MPTLVEDARAAGFSDDEIQQWAQTQHSTWKQAGFSDGEIASYLTGLKNPNGVPPSFIDRIWSNMKNIGEGAAEAAQAGFGSEPIGVTPEDERKLEEAGIFRSPEQRAGPLFGGPQPSGIQLANEAIIKPVAAGVELMFRGANAALMGVGGGVGEAISEATGANEAESARARRDWANFLSIGALLAGAYSPVKRPGLGGVDETVGHLPASSDFTDAAKSVSGGEVKPAVRDKIVRLYEERGQHPAEVAADAALDSALKADLASDKPELPEQYPFAQGDESAPRAPVQITVRPEEKEAPALAPQPVPPESGGAPAGAVEPTEATPKNPLVTQHAGQSIEFPDADHAAMYKFGRKLAEGEKPDLNEARRLYGRFRGFIMTDPEYGVTFNNLTDVRKAALDYYRDATGQAEMGKSVEADSLIEPDLAFDWHRMHQKEATSRPTVPPPAPESHPEFLMSRRSPRAARNFDAASVAAAPNQPAGVFMFDPNELATDAKRFQYKEGGDVEGVNETLKGVTRFDPSKGNQLIVWQDKDGKLFVVDGHQRTGLARRLIVEGHAPIKIPGLLYRASDGFSAEQVRAIAAAKNIAEGSGTAIDAANAPLRGGSKELSADSLFGDAHKQKDLFGGMDEPPPPPFGTPPGGSDEPPPSQRYFSYDDRGGFAKAFSTVIQGWQKTFQPELVSDAALRADPLFARYKSATQGQKDRVIARAEQERQFWRGKSEAKRLDYIDRLERGEELSLELREKAQRHRRMLDAAHRIEAEYGSKAYYLDEYFPHIWERPLEAGPFMQVRIGQLGPTWFQKARAFDFVKEGIEAGLRLKSSNPEDLVTLRLLATADMTERMTLLRALKDMGLSIEQAAADADLPRRGWQQISAPNREHWLIAPDILALWKNAVDAKGLWANDGAPGSMFRGWMALKNVWVPIKLSLSLFHPLHVLHINWTQGALAGARQMLHGDVIDGLRSIVGGFVEPVQAAIPKNAPLIGHLGAGHVGKQARAAWLKPASQRTPWEKATVSLMHEGGFVPSLSEELRIAGRRAMEEAIDRGAWLKAVPQMLRHFIEALQAPVFQEWIPNIKAAAYLRDAQMHLSRHPELLDDPQLRGVALRTIAKSIDNRFGEMFYGNLFWNRYVKDAGIGSFLSLGWNLGFAREFGGAATGPLARLVRRVMRGPATAAEQAVTEAQSKLAYAIAYTSGAMLINGLMTYGFTGAAPSGLDWFLPRVGGTNPDGSPRRVTNMFYTREVPMAEKHIQEHGGNILSGLGGMLWNKLMVQPVEEILENRDYYGSEIWDVDAPMYKQVWQTLKHTFGQQFNPITLSGAKRALTTGGTWRDAGMAFLGFGPAPAYASKSATQNRIQYLYLRHVAPEVRAHDVGETAVERADLRGALLRAKQSGDRAALTQAAREWLIAGGSKQSLANVLEGVTTDVAMFRALPEVDQRAIMAMASPEEKLKYQPYLKTDIIARVGDMALQAQGLREQGNTASAAEIDGEMQGLIKEAHNEGRLRNAGQFRRSVMEYIATRRARDLSQILAIPRRIRSKYAQPMAAQ